MKIRNGFVSNSSSSSFVIGKNFMTGEQIDLFNKWRPVYDSNYHVINEFDTYHEYATVLTETNDYYFGGNIDQNVLELYVDYLTSIGVDATHIAMGE